MTVKVVLCEAFNAIGAVTPFSLNPVPLTEACEMLTVDALLLVSVMFRVDFGGSQQKHAGRPTPGFTKVKPPPVQAAIPQEHPPESPAFPSCELKFQLVPRFRARV